MTQLKPLDLWAVELPDGAKNVRVFKDKLLAYIPAFKGVKRKQLTEGNWQFLFTTQTATEQDWAGVVGWFYDNDGIKGWYNYPDLKTLWNKPSQSGHSLLTANGLDTGKNWAIVTIK